MGDTVGGARAVASDVDHWRELISAASLPLESTVASGVDFGGEVEARLVDGVVLMRVESVAQTVCRTAAGCRRSPTSMIKVLVQRRGNALMEQRDQRSILPARAMTVYDTSRPYTIVEQKDFRADAVLLPRERLPLTAETLSRIQRHPIDTTRGPGALFVSYLDNLQLRIDECSPSAGVRCTSVLVELLAAALAEVSPSDGTAPALQVSVRDWIRRHLADQDLGPSVVASANGISVRYLHRLFEESGVSVSGFIRAERLRRIRGDLANPLYRGQTIAAIGARWGIPDQRHLSRLFRREFALTPRDARRQVAAAS